MVKRKGKNGLKGITKLHRRYPDTKWDYKALSKRVGNKEIYYYTLKNKNKKSKGVEIFSGKNYIVGTSAPSYSRRYNVSKVPKIHKKVVSNLMKQHKKVKWSKKRRVDLN